jgi:transposase
MLYLKRKDKKIMERMVRKGKTEQRMSLRAQIVLLFAQGLTAKQVAAKVSTTVKTARKWKKRYVLSGIKGLYDLPRQGAPPKFSVGQRLEIIAIACDFPKNYCIEGYSKWTYNLLTEACRKKVGGPAMSRTSIFRTLDKIELKPHKRQMWLHSKDPKFKEKTNDIVSLYLSPPQDAVVLCVDEKTGIQANQRKNETKCAFPGKPARYEYEYIRHGTQSLLASFNIKTGEVLAECRDSRKADDLISFMEAVASHHKNAEKIIIVWDNLNIHKDGPTERWRQFNRRHNNKFQFHFTPLHASWVNQIEIFFSILEKRCLRHGNFYSKKDLKVQLLTFIRRWNIKDGHPFNWTFKGYPIQKREAA